MPAIAWFDRILADVGDSQNLQESLSTFSGHIKRVKGILGSITRHSLVLLDEVILHLLSGIQAREGVDTTSDH